MSRMAACGALILVNRRTKWSAASILVCASLGRAEKSRQSVAQESNVSSSFSLRLRRATKSIPSCTILACRVASEPHRRNRPGKLRHLRCSCSPICTVSSRGSAKTDLGVRRYLSTTNPASIDLVTVLPLPSNASALYSHSAKSSFMIWSRSVTAACCSFVRKKIWGAIFFCGGLPQPRSSNCLD